MALLATISEVFIERRADRLTTAELLRVLVERDDGPWSEWWGKAVAAGDTRGPGYRLARLLKPYGVRRRDVRTPEGTRKGFLLADFEDAFTRYLPSSHGKLGDDATMQAGHTSLASPWVTDGEPREGRGDGQEAHHERNIASSLRLPPVAEPEEEVIA